VFLHSDSSNLWVIMSAHYRWAHKCPKNVEQITNAISDSVAFSWFPIQEHLLIIGRRNFSLRQCAIRNFYVTEYRLLQWCSEGLSFSGILSTVDWLQTFCDYLSVSVLLDCLTLEDGTKTFSRRVGKPATYRQCVKSHDQVSLIPYFCLTQSLK